MIDFGPTIGQIHKIVILWKGLKKSIGSFFYDRT